MLPIMPEPVAPHHGENLFFVYGTLRQKAANDITLQCFVYEMNLRFTHGKPVIASGDWLAASNLLSK